ncbi:MAG TPA: protease modulator HflC, partial [Marinobacter sp.]|nr:protease modulator HflC [Marinobacter sp.]
TLRSLAERAAQTAGFHGDVYSIRIEFPGQVSENVFRRMATERMKLAQEFRSRGRELAEGIRADADRQRTVVLAEAFSRSERTRGEGDGEAAKTYAAAYGSNPDFYSFYRSLEAYRNTFSDKGDLMVIDANSAFLKFLKDPQGAN